MTLKELQDQGYVSKCGRWLKDPSPLGVDFLWGCEGWIVDTGYIDLVFKWEFEPWKDDDEIKLGLVFYSKEHAELARDTMEAEQMVRKEMNRICYSSYEKNIYYLFNDTKQRIMPGWHTQDVRPSDTIKVLLKDRFGEERLQEILNQELKQFVV